MLYVSKKLTPAFNKPTLNQAQPKFMQPTSLCDWAIREVDVQEFNLLLCINLDTQMPIVLPGVEFLKVSPVSALQQVLMFVMAGMGISSLKFVEYVSCVLMSEVKFQNTTSNFLTEAAFRAYLPELKKVDLNRFDDEHLLNQIGLLSLTLGGDRKLFHNLQTPDQAPAVCFKNKINYAWQIPAQRQGIKVADMTSLKQWQSKDFNEVKQGNDDYLARYAESLKQFDLTDLDQELYLSLATNYLNKFLLTTNSRTLLSDLTAPTAYLFEWLLERGEIKPMNRRFVIEAMLEFGDFMVKSGVYSMADGEVYRQAVFDGGNRVRAFFDAAGNKHASPKPKEVASVTKLMAELNDDQLVHLLIRESEKRPALFDQLLAKLTVAQRQLLAQKLTQFLNKK